MEIYLVRHIEPLIEKGICYGHSDVIIPNDYAIKHQQIINTLPTNFDVVYSSPLTRCKLLAEQISTKVIYDKRLMEVNFGIWEEKKWDEINQQELNFWMENYITVAPPNGESLTDLMNRFSDFIIELKAKNYSKVLIIAHAGIIRCAMNIFNNISLNKVMMEKVSYGEVFKFDIK